MNTIEKRPYEDLQLLLLDLIAPARTVNQSQLDAVTSTEWQVLLEMAHEHRLEPLLHWQLARAHSGLSVPVEIKVILAQSHRQASMRSLTFQRELLLVQRLLDQAGIPSLALKGAYLAFHAYPQAGLRPMRDLDILVPSDQALQAYRVLIDGGLSRTKNHDGSPEAAMLVAKHLPPLRSASGLVSVELHCRLLDPAQKGLGLTDLCESPGFWDRCIKVETAGQFLHYLSPTDLLMHLIVHAVYEHKLDNGPLLLSDLAFLIESQAIDWPAFWAMAAETKVSRGCELALVLTQIYWGVSNVCWPAGHDHARSRTSDVVRTAALLMLVNFENRGGRLLLSDLGKGNGLSGKFRRLLRKTFPSRNEIAAKFPVDADRWQVYLWYLVKISQAVKSRAPAIWKHFRRPHFQQQVQQLNFLKRWLAQ